LEGGEIAAAGDDIEDDYEIVRRQHSEKRARIARQRLESVEV
jgi:hypothetical protein